MQNLKDFKRDCILHAKEVYNARMRFDSRVGLAALIMGCFGVAAFWLWPDQKWIGWVFLAASAAGVCTWVYLEVKPYAQNEIVIRRIGACLLAIVISNSMVKLFQPHPEMKSLKSPEPPPRGISKPAPIVSPPPKKKPFKPGQKAEAAPKEINTPTTVVVAAPYGNLAKRCEDLGNGIIQFVSQRNQMKPAVPDSQHQQEYWNWYRQNDGQFRWYFYDEAKALLKDLNVVNIKDRRLDELIERHERYFYDRNHQPVQNVIDHSMMYHLSIEDIAEIGQRFQYLATQVPR